VPLHIRYQHKSQIKNVGARKILLTGFTKLHDTHLQLPEYIRNGSDDFPRLDRAQTHFLFGPATARSRAATALEVTGNHNDDEDDMQEEIPEDLKNHLENWHKSRIPSHSTWNLAPFETAAKDLGVDPRTFQFKHESFSLTLKPSQVQGAHWLTQMEFDDTLKGAILGDQMGMGKTLTLFLYAWFRTKRLDGPPYKPLLLLSTPAGTYTFEQEFEQHRLKKLGLRFGTLAYNDSMVSSTSSRRRYMVSKQQLVQAQAGEYSQVPHFISLDPNDPKTALTVLVDSYNGWALKSLKRTSALERQEAQLQQEAAVSIVSHLHWSS
jgi:SNF2 family DNA or RNA helicase